MSDDKPNAQRLQPPTPSPDPRISDYDDEPTSRSSVLELLQEFKDEASAAIAESQDAIQSKLNTKLDQLFTRFADSTEARFRSVDAEVRALKSENHELDGKTLHDSFPAGRQD